jgi:hypothetical protein
VLLVLPSPVRASAPVGLAVLLVVVAGAALVVRALPRQGTGRTARALRAAASDLRGGVLARDAWPGIVVASVVVVAGHTATLLVAARTAGVTASTARLLPLLVLVLLAMAVPTNVGGWGPREGGAAALFALAGLGAAQGVAAATVFGVLALAGTLPGAVVLLASRGARPARRPPLPVPEADGPGPARHGAEPGLAEDGVARG